jgi:ankyrin repeat protein
MLGDKNDYNPIHDAFSFFDLNEGGDANILIYLLLQDCIDVNIKGGYDRIILYYACENIDHVPLDVFKCLIETKGGNINCLDQDKNTPLHLLMRFLSQKLDDSQVSQIVEYLIKKGANVNHTVPLTHSLTHDVRINNRAKLGKDCYKKPKHPPHTVFTIEV